MDTRNGAQDSFDQWRELSSHGETEKESSQLVPWPDQDLASKLERRNALLDEIRLSYHRDVVVLKEGLYQLRKAGVLHFDTASEANSHAGKLTLGRRAGIAQPRSSRRPKTARSDEQIIEDIYTSLISIPSTNIRPVLRLLDPAECYLRIRACPTCGGTADIVHTEHACFQRLRRDLQEKEQQANERVAKAAQRVEELEIQNAKREKDMEDNFTRREAELVVKVRAFLNVCTWMHLT
jgi:hypothetical protein